MLFSGSAPLLARETRPMERSVNKLQLLLSTFILASSSTLYAQQYAPTIDFESLLNTYIDDKSGLISFQKTRIIFAPDGKFNGRVAVLDSDNKVLGHFTFYEDYQNKNGVYAQALAKGPADITLTKPGIYTIAYVIDGKPASRLPFRLVQSSAGDDPFKPEKSYHADGYWRTFAFILMDEWKGEKWPQIHYWLGGVDLPEGKKRASQIATLLRNGEIVAHSKRTASDVIKPGHFEQARNHLYHPHEAGKEYKARPFLLTDWLIDGSYELRVNRLSDNIALRSYDFRVDNGAIEPHPRSKLGYQPHIDYIAPRVQKRGATSLEMVEAIWIEDRKI